MNTQTQEQVVQVSTKEAAILPYVIEFPLGDWSGDGHEECKYYRVHSSHPVEVLREAHFGFEAKFGFDIGDMASEYEESYIADHILELMQDHEIIDYLIPGHDDEDDYDEEGHYYPEGTEELLHIWLRCLQLSNPELVLRVEEKERIPSINFYGFDEKKRHLNVPGYGMLGQW